MLWRPMLKLHTSKRKGSSAPCAQTVLSTKRKFYMTIACTTMWRLSHLFVLCVITNTGRNLSWELTLLNSMRVGLKTKPSQIGSTCSEKSRTYGDKCQLLPKSSKSLEKTNKQFRMFRPPIWKEKPLMPWEWQWELLAIGCQDFMNYDGISNLERAKNISIGTHWFYHFSSYYLPCVSSSSNAMVLFTLECNHCKSSSITIIVKVQ